MNNVMLDLETMGKTINASIMSIGACYFNPLTGEIGEKFHQEVNIGSYGNIEQSTVIWWLKQDHDARSKFFNNEKAKTLKEVLSEFSTFVNINENVKVWGNGIGFDNAKLVNAYESFGLETPWEFRNDRDVRTIVELGLLKGINPKLDLEFTGVKHDALADAIHQAKYVSVIYNEINESVNFPS